MDVSAIDLSSVDHVLTTTRAVRKRLDLTRPVEPEIIERCIEIAVQAPTALYGETWHFLVVTGASQRQAVAAIYRKAGQDHRAGEFPWDPYLASLRATSQVDPRFQTLQRVFGSAGHLIRHVAEVPVLLLACVEGRVETAGTGAQASLYGSIFPAVWSLMLAFRARGIGSVMTTQHIGRFEHEMAAVLGLPDGLTQAALLAVAYFTGNDFKPARRAPAADHTHWDRWGQRKKLG